LQKANQNYFKDRSVYYSTFPIQQQAKKGKWNFRLNAVYTVSMQPANSATGVGIVGVDAIQ